MSTVGLPGQADVRKLAACAAVLEGSFQVAELGRLRQALADTSGSGRFRLVFGIDADGRALVTGEVSAAVRLCCQRCLQAMPVRLASELNLAVVTGDEQARALPKALGPLLAGVDPIDLAAVLEDELLLALPIVAMHRPDDCPVPAGYVSTDPDFVHDGGEDGENPFTILEQLKRR